MSSIQWIDHTSAADSHLSKQTIYVGQGGQPKEIRRFNCSFRVYYRGLNHVAGIIYSTDGWATRTEWGAVFSGFAGSGQNGEIFSIQKDFDVLIGRIEYIIWCEDYRCIDSLKKIYKTSPVNGGEPFISIYPS